MTEYLPQAGDPLIEGARLEAMHFGVSSAPEAAVAPSPHMITPERVSAGGGRSQGRRARGGGRLRRIRFLGCDDPDVVRVVQRLACAWCGAALGGKAAHLALDRARVVASSTRDDPDLQDFL